MGLRQYMSNHTIAKFRLANGCHNFIADSAGKYIIAIEGGFFAKTNDVFSVYSKDTGENADLKSTLPYAFFEYGVRCVEVYSFTIKHPGEYELRIANAEKMEVRKSRLILAKIFESPLKQNDVTILIMSRGYYLQ